MSSGRSLHRVVRPAVVAALLVLTATFAVSSAPMVMASAVPTGDGPAGASRSVVNLQIAGGPVSVEDRTAVALDATLWLPAQVPAPAVVLAHGFGGSKDSVSAAAAELVNRGFVVLAYSARGFGASTGQISMNASAFEVADARAAIDVLAARPEVLVDGPGDPRVGFAGRSYGGALALLVAGEDPRVDAVAADITWHDLESALFPQQARTASSAGVLGPFKKEWAAWFFSGGLGAPVMPGDAAQAPALSARSSSPAATTGGESVVLSPNPVTICGRFTPAWCSAYIEAAVSGRVSDKSAALMRDASPARVAARIAIPTLLGGGLSDSLFPIDQVNATAEEIRRAHPQVPLSVVWHAGGHGAPDDPVVPIETLMADWLSQWLVPDRTPAGSPSVPPFTATLANAEISLDSTRASAMTLVSTHYPGVFGSDSISVDLAGPAQRALVPAGGLPAALTSLPGLGSLGNLLPSGALPEPAGQSAFFRSKPLPSATTIIGSPRISITVSSAAPLLTTAAASPGTPMCTPEVTLFASLRVIGASGRQTTPGGLVAPIRLVDVGPTPQTVTVVLPAIVATAVPGDSLEVVVSTTDRGYRLPQDPAVVTLALADDALVLPLATMDPVQQGSSALLWLMLGIAVPAIVAVVVWLRRPRPTPPLERADLAEVPLAVENLSKQFTAGMRVVDGLSFVVPRGAVLGLLGPNGAGKTTTMRMVMGLIEPSDGAVYVFGRRVWPGAPVLSRIGSLVEGAGFLPFLSGRENLDLFWRAKGTGEEPHDGDDVLAIADLGSALDRRVKTYSQGMRQRLGIAQAMLGYPDILILDEPTNGLDPPQIKAMRDVLQEYAASGRTVVVSSHLLSEVQATCSHVVVMHRGRLVAAGTVEEILAGRDATRLEDAFLDIVGTDLTIGQG